MAEFENEKKAGRGRIRSKLKGSEQVPGSGKPVAPPPGQAPSGSEGPDVADTERFHEPLFTIAEVARFCRMSERTVRRRIKDGTIRKALAQGRLVRISAEELRRLSTSSQSINSKDVEEK